MGGRSHLEARSNPGCGQLHQPRPAYAKIYHVKGQEDYEATIIRYQYGERWFCSESDARTAGWRRAGR
ncbi:sunset domain-containing protein [Rhizobium leguminosarum]